MNLVRKLIFIFVSGPYLFVENINLIFSFGCICFALSLFSQMNPNESGDNLGNPVGELQEMTQKRMWPPPVYSFTNEQGPPHAREFICTVKILTLEETRM